MAKVIKAFDGLLEGEDQPRRWNVGDTVPAGSDLERVAFEQGWCKKKAPARTKSLGGAPANKSASSRPVRAARKKTRSSSRPSVKK